jgi:hypothetical protein
MIEQLQNEIDLIQDQRIKHLVIETLKLAPEYFWTAPGSSTGKHHPQDEICTGGKVLHVRKAVKIGLELCDNFNITGFRRDVVIAALILHDICCFGYPTNSGYTVNGHGYLVGAVMYQAKARFIDGQKVPPEMPNPSDAREVLAAISTHMGRWDYPFDTPHDAVQLVVHLADLFVSRRCVKIDFEVNE